MGKPIAKKYLGDQESEMHIKAFFHNGTKPTPGFVVKQLGSRKFRCEDQEGNTAICSLVQRIMKDPNNIEPGEMIVAVQLDEGIIVQVGKIANRNITIVSSDPTLHNKTQPWDFINKPVKRKPAAQPFIQGNQKQV